MFELTPFDRRNHRHLSRYNPFKELEDMERNFWNFGGLMEFNTDIKDEGKEYLLEADLPGFSKEDIHVDVEDNYLTIRAARGSETEETDDKNHYVRRERSYGSYQRSFDVSNIKQEAITVQYKDGVLKVHLPKKEGGDKPNARRLPIGE